MGCELRWKRREEVWSGGPFPRVGAVEKSLPSLPITDPEPSAVFVGFREPGLLRGGTEWGGGKLASLLPLSKPGRPMKASLLDLWGQHLVKHPP